MALHAFQPRDFFTCSECLCFQPRDGLPYCSWAQKRIRYDPRAFGCGDYTCTHSGEIEKTITVELRGEVRRFKPVVIRGEERVMPKDAPSFLASMAEMA